MTNTAFDWARYIKECLDGTEYCCLATNTTDSVWANPVYFSYDSDVSLYFISQPHSLHMKNIERSPKVSVAIFSTAQSTHGDVWGIQLNGDAKIIRDLSSAQIAYECYYGRVFPNDRKNTRGPGPADYINDDSEWQFVKVTTLEMWYFDNRFFGEERARVPSDLSISGI